MILDILSWCPGVLGLVLRQKLYPLYLKECGKDTIFGRFVKLKGSKNIHIGNNVVINDWAVLNAEQRSENQKIIRIEDNVFIGASTTIEISGEDIIIKKNSNIGSECRIVSKKRTVLESNVLVAAYCRIGGNLSTKKTTEREQQKVSDSDVSETRIGQGCWLGVRVITQAGVSIGHETVVGAHALVEHNLPENIVAVGKPARQLYSRM